MIRPLKTALLTASLALAGLGAAGAQESLTVTHVAGTVHLLAGPGGNIAVSAGDDGLLMVDDKFERLAGDLQAVLAELGDGELDYLLNTHYHGDHTGANHVFGGSGTPILAHHNVRARLLTGDGQPAGLPVVTFDEGLTVHFNGQAIEVRHAPAAHTDGDAMVSFTGDDVLHMGDTFFHERFPYIDVDAGGRLDGILAAVDQVLATAGPQTRIIPGHGPLADVDDLRTYRRMLTETRDRVQAGLDAGLDLEGLQAAGVPAEWTGYSWQFISTERWIETLHRLLTQ